MPFRESHVATRAPGSGVRWLRRIFIEDWGLKLLALAITLVLWFFVSGREIDRELVVEPHYDGKPAATYEVKEVLATPAKVRVTGPASHVNALEKVSTEAVSVEGRHESFDVPHTSIDISDPEVVIADKVNVHVTIVPIENQRPKSRETN